MHLLDMRQGIIEVKRKNWFKRMLCKHPHLVRGENCSSIGLVRISGYDYYVLCKDCGEVIGESHHNY